MILTYLFADFIIKFYHDNVSGVHFRKLGQNYTVQKISQYPSDNINPGSPLFSLIKNHGNIVYKITNEYCDHDEKLATARQQLIFNLKCKRLNLLPKSLRF